MSDKLEVMRLELQEIAEMSSLERGDHLAVEEKYLFKTYFHHGIYLGTNFQVADFGSIHSNRIASKKDLLLFKGKQCLFRYIYPPDTCREPEAVASVAEEVVENPDLWGPYDVLKNNCEHFATRCKVGSAYSIQVTKMSRLEMAAATSGLKCTVM